VNEIPLASYSHDDNGNTTADGAHTYEYSEANRLATVDGYLPIYTYDGANRRVEKQDYEPTYYFFDPAGRLLTELIMTPEQGGGTAHGRDYVYLPDAPVARVDWAVVTNPDYHTCPPRAEFCPPPRIAISDLLYYHTDHLGTPIAMSNQGGELVWKAEYLPFGELFSTPIATVENNLRFPGQYFDSETGLHQNWFRDYSPKTGRYTEADPIGLSGGANPYAYVNNGPTTGIDPYGLWNLWNPLSWGQRNAVSWSWTDSLIPWHDSSGYARESFIFGFEKGGAAFLDGVIPFADPFADSGVYDTCDPGLQWSRRIGEWTRDVELILASGPRGPLFGKGGPTWRGSLGPGIFNRGATRLGWSWFGKAKELEFALRSRWIPPTIANGHPGFTVGKRLSAAAESGWLRWW